MAGSIAAPGCWYAVHTRSNFESRVAEDLQGKGIEHFVPSYEEVHQWKDRRKTVRLPLFPGYVFVRVQDSNESRIHVLRTRGVVRILGNGTAIEPVPEPEIEAVRAIVNARTRCTPFPFLSEGSPVRVIRGALAGLEGLLVKIKNQTRLVVSVSLLARSVAAEVDAWNIEPIHGPNAKCIRT